MPDGRLFALEEVLPDFAYIPSGWDDSWNAGRATRNPKALLIGASDASGYLASDCATKSFPELFRTRMVAQYGVWGDFYHSRLNIVDSTSWTGTPAFVNNGASPTQQLQGYGSLDTWTATGSTLLTFTTPYPCTQMDIIYLDAAGASPPQYAVDGGSQTAFPALGSTGAQLRLSITGLAKTTHTLTLRQQSASSLRCMGVATYANGSTATSGFGFARMNYPGSYGMGYLRQDGYFGLFPNGYNQVDYLADATSAPLVRPITTGFGWPTGSYHLLILVLDLMGNDCNLSTTSTTPSSPQASHEAMRRILSAARRAVNDVAILLVIPSVPDGVYSDLLAVNSISNAVNWQDYKAKAWDLAQEFNCAVVDSDADFANRGVMNGFQTQALGGFHLTDAGHARTDALIQQVVG